MSTSAVVFCGPTIPPDEARRFTGADCRPPVALGDVYRAQRQGVRIVGIVDGYFERVPAVWHKEILWALTHGVRVVGASSMGALRAAELADFGMHGVGAIYEQYRSGALRRDDEVAVAHAPVADGLVPLSVALVNMRATLARAADDGVIAVAEAQRLVERAAATFYPERSWGKLLADAPVAGLGSGAVEALRAWLPGHEIDVKRQDAMVLLELIEVWRNDGAEPTPATYAFSHTAYWDNAMRECDLAGAGPTSVPARVVDEVKLDPGRYGELREQTLTRAVAIEVGAAKGYTPTPEDLEEAAEDFRRARRLWSAEALGSWLAERDLDEGDWRRLVREHAYERWVRRAAEASLEPRLVEHLRLGEDYPGLVTRAHDKAQRLRGAELDDVSSPGGELSTERLCAWWFGDVHHRPVPDDLATWVHDHGLELSDYLRALRREYWYRHLGGPADGPGVGVVGRRAAEHTEAPDVPGFSAGP